MKLWLRSYFTGWAPKAATAAACNFVYSSRIEDAKPTCQQSLKTYAALRILSLYSAVPLSNVELSQTCHIIISRKCRLKLWGKLENLPLRLWRRRGKSAGQGLLNSKTLRPISLRRWQLLKHVSRRQKSNSKSKHCRKVLKSSKHPVNPARLFQSWVLTVFWLMSDLLNVQVTPATLRLWACSFQIDCLLFDTQQHAGPL